MVSTSLKGAVTRCSNINNNHNNNNNNDDYALMYMRWGEMEQCTAKNRPFFSKQSDILQFTIKLVKGQL